MTRAECPMCRRYVHALDFDIVMGCCYGCHAALELGTHADRAFAGQQVIDDFNERYGEALP